MDLAQDPVDVLDGLERMDPSILDADVELVGHSWGGPIVRATALERPGRVPLWCSWTQPMSSVPTTSPPRSRV